jgi:hypothetical protein
MPTKHAAFWAELGAPIPPDFVKERSQAGRQFSYITARTVMNRLDAVAGPENWWTEFIPGANSVLCRLSVRTPDGEVVTKMEAGGYAGMADNGDDEKSGVSDALKRAGVLFGIGRELYNDGAVGPHLPEIAAKVSAKIGIGGQGIETVSMPPRPQPQPPEPQAPFDPNPTRVTTIDDLKANGLLKTGAQVYGTPTSPPPQRDLSRDDVFDKVGEMVGAPSPAKPFLQFIQEKCHAGNETFIGKCRHQNLPIPKNDPITPEAISIVYCHRAIENGGLDQRTVTAGGEYVQEACLEALESHYIGDPKATERNLNVDIDMRISEEIVALEREKHKRENEGKAPNRLPDRPQGNPAPPPQRGGNGSAPRSGKALFARAKELEKEYEVNLTAWITGYCKAHDLPGRMVDLSPEQVEMVYEACMEKIGAIRRDDANAEAISN